MVEQLDIIAEEAARYACRLIDFAKIMLDDDARELAPDRAPVSRRRAMSRGPA